MLNLFLIVSILFGWLFGCCEIEEWTGMGWGKNGGWDCYFRGDAEEGVS